MTIAIHFTEVEKVMLEAAFGQLSDDVRSWPEDYKFTREQVDELYDKLVGDAPKDY